MTRPDVEGSVRATCEEVASRYGLELIEVSFKGSRGRSVLSVIVDRPGGAVSMQDVTEVSEAISDALDREDPIEGSYSLEVSSAGLERPLTRPEHFVRYTGREISVKCVDRIEGRRNFKGVVISAGEETFVLEGEDGVAVEIAYPDVSRAKLVVDWEAELKGEGLRDDEETQAI